MCILVPVPLLHKNSLASLLGRKILTGGRSVLFFFFSQRSCVLRGFHTPPILPRDNHQLPPNQSFPPGLKPILAGRIFLSDIIMLFNLRGHVIHSDFHYGNLQNTHRKYRLLTTEPPQMYQEVSAFPLLHPECFLT